MASLADWRTEPLTPASGEELGDYLMTYLEAVEVFRAQGIEPMYTSEGEFIPEPTLTVPEEWPAKDVNGNIKSYMPPQDFDKWEGAA